MAAQGLAGQGRDQSTPWLALQVLVDGPCMAAPVGIRRLCFVCVRKGFRSPVAQRYADGPTRAVGCGFTQATDQVADHPWGEGVEA